MQKKQIIQTDRPDSIAVPNTRNVQIVCDLYNLAVTLKSQELRRQNPKAPEKWILSEALNLLERGCR